ncbi:MAG: MerR family transcriptional regulator [Acidobacteriota bacterium]|nr:MerR family transcriptional regulator [Acidobacteriota bacterium]
MSAQHPIRVAAKLSGLSVDVLRVWERRYRAVEPGRTDRVRHYSQEQVQRLILLRELVTRGHSIGQIASKPDAELRDLLNASQAAPRREPVASDIVDSITEAFTNFERTRANEELGRAAALLSPRDLVYRVVLPLMRGTGDRWHSGEIGVAQEHLVSSAVRNLLGSLVRLYPPQPGAPKILMAALSGELHEFGILAAAMIAAISGLDPLVLGPNLPVSELTNAARKTHAQIVLVGASGAPARPDDLKSLAVGLPEGAQLWIGGYWTSDDIPSAVFLKDMEAFESACRSRSLTLQ